MPAGPQSRAGALPDNERLLAALANVPAPEGKRWVPDPAGAVFYADLETVLRVLAERAGLPHPDAVAALCTAVAVQETGATAWKRRVQHWPTDPEYDNDFWNIRAHAGGFGPHLSQAVADFVHTPALAGVADSQIGRGGVGPDGKPKNGYFEAYPTIFHSAGRILHYLWRPTSRYAEAHQYVLDPVMWARTVAQHGYVDPSVDNVSAWETNIGRKALNMRPAAFASMAIPANV
jgi:hypothetical protein